MTKDGKDDLEAVRVLADTLGPFDDQERSRIIRWACEKLGMPMLSSTLKPASGQPAIPPPAYENNTELPLTPGSKKHRDIKSFVNEKNPQNDKQLAAVVAYYYAFEAPETQRKTSIGATDLTDACRLADRRRSKKPIQTLINAAHSGFLDKAEESGMYRLNAVGENLVAMTLPSTAVPKRLSPKTRKNSGSVTKRRKTNRTA